MATFNKRVGLRLLVVCSAAFLMPATGRIAFAASPSGAVRCERLLAEAKRITERNVRSERVGLWERLRSVREACADPDVPATVRARAALVYRILPEYSELLPRVALLESIEAELELLPAPTPELIEIVELKAGALEMWGKVDEAGAVIENSLRLRATLYGEESTEFASGLLGSARFHATISDQSSFERELALSLADQAIVVVRRSRTVTEEDRRELTAQARELFEDLGLTAAEIADRISPVSGVS
jgi:hypothetical protein